MAAEIAEHFLFREYSREIKSWLNNECHLSRYPEDKNVLVVYATPGRAFAKYIYPILNGDQIQPTISFTLTNSAYKQNENLLGFVTQSFFNETSKISKIVKPLLVYELTYNITIRTVLMSDMDILTYQLLTNSSRNSKSALIIDDQWAELMTSDPREETNLEPGDAQDRIIRRGFDLTVPRAYLPRAYTESGVIEEYELDYRTVEEIV
jgi:hypothetical protein